MATRPEIQKTLPTPSSTGSSFHEEWRELLTNRCKLAFATGLIVSLATHLFEKQFPVSDFHRMRIPVDIPLDFVTLLYAISFGLATAIVFSRSWSVRSLLILDYLLITFNLLLSSFLGAIHVPAEVPLYAVALLLFIHAAFIPVTVAHQTGLAVTAAVGFPLAVSVGYIFVPEIQTAWENLGPVATLEGSLLSGTFSLAVLGAVSVLMTWTLYNMRRSLHRAQRLGNYEVQRELGRGGMGRVYVARHALMCRPTALKVLEPGSGQERTASARFEREVRLSSTLTHPNTITIYDFGRTRENTFYYAMEYLEGLDLQGLVERFGPLPAERIVYVLLQAAGSLAEAHTRNIIHRDIKPSNIFLTHRGGLYDFVKVLDFGLAKELRADGAAGLTKTGTIFGTPRYLAPETVHGSDSVDGRADLYSLGGVAYWMLTGQPPFPGESSVEVIIDHVKTPPRRPTEISEMPIPPELDDIVMRCLEKKPERRFQRAADLATALRSVPFARPWNQERAREWWRLHAPEDARVAECYFRAQEGSGGVEILEPVTSA